MKQMKQQKIKLLSILMMLFIATPACVKAKTYFCLIDISGSISHCKNSFRKNLLVVNDLIGHLKKGQRIIIYAYRSNGSLVEVVDAAMPKRSGPKNKFIEKARIKIRRSVGFGLKRALKEATGEGTDCIGALNQALLIISDVVEEGEDTVLLHFSDGFQTIGVGSFKPQAYKGYLKRLQRQLEHSGLIKQHKVSQIVWFGETCNLNQKMTLNQAAYLKTSIRRMWLKFLIKNLQGVKVSYLLNYESGKIFKKNGQVHRTFQERNMNLKKEGIKK